MKITQDILDAYVHGHIDDAVKAEVDTQMSDNESLREDLEMHALVINGLESVGRSDFLSTLRSVEESLDQNAFFSDDQESEVIKGIEKEGNEDFLRMLDDVQSDLEAKEFFEKSQVEKNSTQVVSFNRNKYMAIAASVAVLFLAAWWLWPSPQSNEQMYEEYFAMLPDEMTEQIESELDEVGFAGGDNQLLENLKITMSQYHSGEHELFYKGAELALGRSELSHYHDQLIMYQTAVLMENGKYHEAKNKISMIEEDTVDSKWYKILISLKLDQRNEALETIENFDFSKSEYKDKVEKIKRQIKSN